MERIFTSTDYQPILLQFLVAFTFVVIVMVVTHTVVTSRRRIRTLKKEENFECGIEVQGNARFPFSIKYFLIAILFVLFDVEVIFIYPWAINFKTADWSVFLEMLIFIGIFLFGFYYIYKKGALDWNKDQE